MNDRAPSNLTNEYPYVQWTLVNETPVNKPALNNPTLQLPLNGWSAGLINRCLVYTHAWIHTYVHILMPSYPVPDLQIDVRTYCTYGIVMSCSSRKLNLRVKSFYSSRVSGFLASRLH